MKILFIQYESSLWGTSKSLLSIIDKLKTNNQDAFVILAQPGPIQGELDKRNVGHEVIRQYPWIVPENTRWWRKRIGVLKHFWMQRNSKVDRVLARFKPDIIHTNTVKTTLGAWLAKKLNVPHIWHFRSFPEGPHSLNMNFLWSRRKAEEFIWNNSNIRVFISDSLRSHFACTKGDENSIVIFNGVVDLDSIRMRDKDTQCFRAVFLGRFDRHKNPFIAVEAIKKARDSGIPVQLDMVGNGNSQDESQLLDLVQKLNLEDSVNMLGYQADPFQFLGKAHVLIMPSLQDGFGRVIAEAMSTGTVPIAADTAVNRELIDDGVDGLIFNPYSSEEIGRKIAFLYEDSNRRTEFAQRGIQKATDRFSSEEYVSKIANLYPMLLERS